MCTYKYAYWARSLVTARYMYMYIWIYLSIHTHTPLTLIKSPAQYTSLQENKIKETTRHKEAQTSQESATFYRIIGCLQQPANSRGRKGGIL
jgi:hypothetical protein